MGNHFFTQLSAPPHSHSRSTATKESTFHLNQILSALNDARSVGRRSLIIFDIDSTLLDTSFRTRAIFKEFARCEIYKKKYPNLCSQISAWQETVEVYDPIAFVNHHTDSSIVISSQLAAELLKFWKKRFFNEDWLNQDLPYKGASKFVNECTNSDADIAYLTGREEKTLLKGTIRSLATHRFPYDPTNQKTKLVLKSSSVIKDIAYKDEGLESLKVGYDLVFFIENELELVLMALKRHPEIKTYLFDSVHSGRGVINGESLNKISSWPLEN